MQKRMYILFLTLCVIFLVIAGCSQKTVMKELLPENIEKVTVIRSRYSNTNDELTISSNEEWTIWAKGLSAELKSFDEGEAPTDVQAGGESFLFDINDGECSFYYIDFGTEAYILYGDEWYAVSNPVKPPATE